ncbi:hypothetical protein L6452_32013 [Arctium lappa]|uniref:Uncharacterized protein n=1 Tax=Arctium lappa TaxID=4217 RepID=A0ACB8Z3S5_ARCLA|nr:hypothetical protein L6452_32013 [Arctium lappa]
MPGIRSSPALNITGFELTKGNLRFFQTPARWNGRLWGRTDCVFNGSGSGNCASGNCESKELECNGTAYTLPVTRAEFIIDHDQDLYGVSLTDGYNLQMIVEVNGGSGSGFLSCAKTGCVDDLSQRCPMDLWAGGGGCKNVGCEALGAPSDAQMPCNRKAYPELFKSACPVSYSTPNNGQTRLFSCKDVDYTVRFCPSADAFSTIKLGSQLNSSDQLVSVRGNFTLGFFDKDYRYLGIWYTNDVQSRKVWVANPNAPIVSTSGAHALSIDANTGNLIISAGGKTLMNITDVQARPNPNLTATLEDDGNFRLINETDKRVLWQSFDHPTNVLLLVMKLGSSMTTGQNWSLTSWLNNEIPTSGVFTLSWEVTKEASQILMIRRRGQPYWTSGNLADQKFRYLSILYGPGWRSQYDLTSLYNNKERYFSYEARNEALPMWILTAKGQITDSNNSTVWTPEFCYGYESNNGCVNSSLPPCRTKTDNFNVKNDEFASETRSGIHHISSLSNSDCFVKCWNDCHCVGFNSGTANGTGCVIWTGNNSFLVNPRGNSTSKTKTDNFNVKNDEFASETRSGIHHNSRLSISDCFVKCWNDCHCVGFNSGTANGTGCVIWTGNNSFLVNPRGNSTSKRKRDEYFLELTSSETFKDVHQLESNGGKGNDVLLFSFASIMAATGDFSDENKLGQGGFGPVYKSWELWQQGDTLELKDPTLGDTCCIKRQFSRTVHVALICVQESPMDRPTTSDMISMLLNDTMSLPTPKKPAFYTGVVESKSTSDETKAKDCSVNNMTVTVIEARLVMKL